MILTVRRTRKKIRVPDGTLMEPKTSHIWLCSRVMRFQSRPTNWPLITIESPVAQPKNSKNTHYHVWGIKGVGNKVLQKKRYVQVKTTD